VSNGLCAIVVGGLTVEAWAVLVTMPPSDTIVNGDRTLTGDCVLEVAVMTGVGARIRGCEDSIGLSNECSGVRAVAVLESLVVLVHPRAVLIFADIFQCW